MKLSALIEQYEISYDYTKGKNSASVIDFLKLNDVKIADIQKATAEVKKSAEYKKLLSLGYKDQSTPLQERRATIYFVADDGNSQITCYATGQARRANRGGFDNNSFVQSAIKTLPPTQWIDDTHAVEVLKVNLIKSITSVLRTFENKNKRALDGMAAVDARMKKFGFPEGFRIYLESAPKNDKYLIMDEGRLELNAKASGAIGSVVIDFGKNPELGPNIDFGHVEGIWTVTIRGENIQSYKGLEKIFNTGLVAIDIETESPNFRELAKCMKSNNVKRVGFLVNPFNTPLLSLPKICQSVIVGSRATSSLLKNTNVKEVFSKINSVIDGSKDLMDLQDELVDLGYEKTARL